MFQSLGVFDPSSGQMVESDLFPIGQIVELTEGGFPLYDYNDITPDDRHTIGNQVVRVVRFDVSLKPVDPENPTALPEYNSCVLYVEPITIPPIFE